MDMQELSPLLHTQKSFSSAAQRLIGKGADHAALLWAEWMRLGTKNGGHPAFANAATLKETLLASVDWSLPRICRHERQGDVEKFTVDMGEGLEAETVIIPMQAGTTLCVSSQVGCNMGCSFCETGRMGLLKSLSAKEIVAQVYLAVHALNARVRGVVFMGMGEPLDNLDAVLQAVDVMADPAGLSIAKSRITISTSGRVDGIERLTKDLDPAVNLAVSVNAPNDLVRQKIMPVNRRYNMQALHDAMRAYCCNPRREILIEYVLLFGVNDKAEHARELSAYLKGLRAKVNLIPYNAQSSARFAAPSTDRVNAFARILRDDGWQTLVRTTKGDGIMAACGQLGKGRPKVAAFSRQ